MTMLLDVLVFDADAGNVLVLVPPPLINNGMIRSEVKRTNKESILRDRI